MALSFRNSEVESLARNLAARRGTSMTAEILEALQERQARLSAHQEARRTRILALMDRVDRLPVLDGRHPDAILGYDEAGTFR